MDGVIVLDKPFGKTSHDMVSFVRRLTGIRRVGHTGTLDPAATGVLPICIGRATKAADMLTAADKRYIAEMVLGMTTDTQDADGEVLTECEVTCTEENIQAAVGGFVGEISQLPPMYSAVKIGGKKLYELARKGEKAERKPRKVTIYSIDILDIDLIKKTVKIEVACSKGTYIRTLCEDIGIKLGCGAYVNSLRRTKSGMFSESGCITCGELVKMQEEGTLNEAIISTDELFPEFEKIRVYDAEKIKNGVQLRYDGLEEGKRYRVYDENNEFLCVSRFTGGRLTMEKSFWQV